jgi:hypothetical protein
MAARKAQSGRSEAFHTTRTAAPAGGPAPRRPQFSIILAVRGSDFWIWEATNLPDLQLELPVLANHLEVSAIARDHSVSAALRGQRNRHIEVGFARLARADQFS